ncbi:hypothetical protein GGU11DRAFT_861668 [Lentinula aff. detonsa]|nr:hypothetical protein GGU11DRAFT_861668 [Lentinula aff. detonsa]
MRLNHIYVLVGLFAVVHTMPVDASGSDPSNIATKKQANLGTSAAPSHLEHSTHSDDGRVTITFLDPAGGIRTVAVGEDSIPKRVVQRVSEHMRSVLPRWPREDGFKFTNDYILSDLEAEFEIKVTADGEAKDHTIPRDPDPPHP